MSPIDESKIVAASDSGDDLQAELVILEKRSNRFKRYAIGVGIAAVIFAVACGVFTSLAVSSTPIVTFSDLHVPSAILNALPDKVIADRNSNGAIESSASHALDTIVSFLDSTGFKIFIFIGILILFGSAVIAGEMRLGIIAVFLLGPLIVIPIVVL